MELFDKTNQIKQVKEQISQYVSDCGYRMINKENDWLVFDKDERVICIGISKKDTVTDIELSTTLFDDLGLSIEIMIRFISDENLIREILKKDFIRKVGYKLELVRSIKLKGVSINKEVISSQINSLKKKAKRIKRELEMQLDYLMLVKLN